MFSDDDILVAQKIAQVIKLPEQLGACSDGGYFDCASVAEQVKSFEEEYGRCNVYNGISKVVIVFEKLPFVIKIPFNGIWYYDYIYHEDTDEYEEAEESFERFYCADSEYHDDYCEAEVNTIKMIQHFGFGSLVADEICIGNFGCRNYYIQEKVKSSFSCDAKPSNDSLNRAEKIDNYYQFCSATWRAFVFDTYGEDFWKSFIDWAMKENISGIQDMHSGNYGYRFDGTPVMFDISGYDD